MSTSVDDKRMRSSMKSVNIDYRCNISKVVNIYTQVTKTFQSNALLCQKETSLVNKCQNMTHKLSLQTTRTYPSIG